jgi:hypothetical protein
MTEITTNADELISDLFAQWAQERDQALKKLVMRICEAADQGKLDMHPVDVLFEVHGSEICDADYAAGEGRYWGDLYWWLDQRYKGHPAKPRLTCEKPHWVRGYDPRRLPREGLDYRDDDRYCR